MALNGDVLGQLMTDAIDAAMADLVDALAENGTLDPEVARAAYFRAIGGAIVAHILTAQVVVTSVAGVTTGGGVSGPGTGSLL